MSLQNFLTYRITWLPAGLYQRSFNHQYARFPKSKLKIKKVSVNDLTLYPFHKDEKYDYYTTKDNILMHKKGA